MKPALIIHGGAGWRRVDKNYLDNAIKHMQNALRIGWDMLSKGYNSIDVVTEVLSYMEDSGYFNAGTGSCLNIKGYREMDAGIMDGRGSRAGAVTNVRYPKNPIKLARYVMENTDHIILCCEFGDYIAKNIGMPKIPEPPKHVIERFAKLKEKINEYTVRYKRNLRLLEMLGGYGDTIGAVALDSEGNISAAASTGGIWLKLPGRIGDSPIPGAGFYADNIFGLSSTGIGERIIYTMPGITVREYINLGYGFKEAIDRLFKLLNERFGNDNMGLILLTRDGGVYYRFDTPRMLVGYRTVDETFVKLVEKD